MVDVNGHRCESRVRIAHKYKVMLCVLHSSVGPTLQVGSKRVKEIQEEMLNKNELSSDVGC